MFDKGTYTFTCANGYRSISGNNFAVCVNGILNLTAESEFRCVPISTTAVVMILVMILIIVSIHFFRRNKETAVVTEHIGFVMVNDRRLEINPVPASPTSVDSGMEENDLYGLKRRQYEFQ
ncbi:hypothetical protein B566_EDAN013584 [Ephemera danica]|nr:hypothetical protein B566_EDAN013584 [Ephemera danica]